MVDFTTHRQRARHHHRHHDLHHQHQDGGAWWGRGLISRLVHGLVRTIASNHSKLCTILTHLLFVTTGGSVSFLLQRT